jgi:polyhydroxybutyrate depolymerase
MTAQRGPRVARCAPALLLALLACVACATLQANRPLARATEGHTTRHTIVVNGHSRSFYLRLPPGLSASQRYPLLLLLHGHNNNGANILHQSRMEPAADRHHVILVAPNGTGRFGRLGLTWNAQTCCGSAQAHRVDDLAFLETLIDTLAADLPVDRARVALVGFSAGGMLALRAACDRSGIAYAFVNVQGTMPDTTCRPSRPVSMLLIAGDEDEDMREEHAENQRHHGHRFAMSAMGTLRFWARRNGCDPAIVPKQGHEYTEYVATGCASGTATRLVVVHGHPHAWPGGRRSWIFAPSPNPDVDADALIFEFLGGLSPR